MKESLNQARLELPSDKGWKLPSGLAQNLWNPGHPLLLQFKAKVSHGSPLEGANPLGRSP